jgi:microsomal dipeptidase-like Zn-dependent dipeptidase
MPVSILIGTSTLGLLLVAVALALWLVPPALEKSNNRVVNPPPYEILEPAGDRHAQLLVADLHADSLLWKRDLLKRVSYGHVDFPRLAEGNVALQVLAAATQIPRKVSFEHNDTGRDLLTVLAILQAWPPRTWGSWLQRALYQADKLHKLVARSRGRVVVIKRVQDLDQFLTLRQSRPDLVAALLALEGAHALEGDLANLDTLYDAGFRMLGLAHFVDNKAGGSAHGREKGELTAFGRELVQIAQQKRMVIDLAHASPRVVDDVLEMTSAPVVVSHTGLQGTCAGPRNLSDDQIRGIAQVGGVMGIAMFPVTVGGNSLDDTARAIRYGADLVGAGHFALGSDFDGGITAPVDASGLPLLTEALDRRGLSDTEIAKVMGQNVFHLLRETLPH